MAYRIVLAEKACTPVSVACELLGVSTSGFTPGQSRAPSDRDLSNAWLVERIKHVHRENRGVYGSRRVSAELRLGEGVVVSRKRVQRLMRQVGLSGLTKVKRGRTTIRVPGVRVADDVVERRFRPERPDLLWVADITHLRTWEGGSISPPFRTPTAAASSAGAWPTTCAPSSSSARSRWPCTAAGRARA